MDLAAPEFELDPNGWGSKLYEGYHKARIAERGLGRVKPAVAIWGPSQVGKSTLFARYLQSGADETGYGSGLQWVEETPILFDKKPESPDGVLTWNPYNFGADASACITCFFLEEAIPYPDFPVEVRLSSPKQVLHAIACGYMSECQLEEATGFETWWTMEELEKTLQELGKRGPPSRQCFEMLQSIVELMNNFIAEGMPRFAGLNGKSADRMLMQSVGVFQSQQSVIDFASNFFWDSLAPLTNLYKDLLASLGNISQLADSLPIYCSYEVARILNDLGVYSRLSGGKLLDGNIIQEHQPTQDIVRRISYKVDPGNALLIGLDVGEPLFRDFKDFALLQGVVWELGVPLNRYCMEYSEESYPLMELLEHADLLDFPGVAKEGTKSEELKLSVPSLDTPDFRHMLFSKVLKRGKTASILYASAKEARIGILNVLVRADEHLGQAKQIYHGVKTWWKAITGQPFRQADTKDAKLNLIFTFFGEIVNNLILNPGNPNIPRLFDRFECLDKIKDPKVTTIFATNYHQYSPFTHRGRNQNATEEEIVRAKQDLVQEPLVKALFADNIESAKEVFDTDTGGADYFLKVVKQQASQSKARQKLTDMVDEADDLAMKLIHEALPEESDDPYKMENLDEWQAELYDKIFQQVEKTKDTSYLKKVSQAIRSLVSVEPESLNLMPSELKNHQNAYGFAQRYVKVQVENWKRSKQDFPLFKELGFDDGIEFQKALNYLAESIDTEHITQWVLETFGRLSDYGRRQAARRLLAVKLSDMLHSDLDRESHCPDEFSNEWLRAFASKSEETHAPEAEEAINSDPHYQAVVYPFLCNIASLKETPSTSRPQLPGDKELIKVLGKD